MKNLIRRGWLLRDLSHPSGRVESDAEHTFSCCLLALEIMGKEKLTLNKEKVLRILLCHDLCEIDAGDCTPIDNVSPQEKHEKELACVERLSKQCDLEFIKDAWNEFEQQQTAEAKFAKAIDKLDGVLQCKIYCENGDSSAFEEFYQNALPYIKDYVKYIDFEW